MYDELWNKIYSDRDVESYLDKDKIGFEIRISQGAKPSLDGVIRIYRLG